MKNYNVFRPAAFAVVALSLGIIGTTGAGAAVLTTNFSDYSGLAYGVGTTQTIAQNGIQLEAIQGMYEVTFYPEVNMKDFPGTGATRVIQLDLEAGGFFDFVGFDIRDLSPNLMTVTSDRGGNYVLPAGFQTYLFSGPEWEDLTWVRFSYTGLYTEAKFTSFSLAPVEAVPVEAQTWSSVKEFFK